MDLPHNYARNEASKGESVASSNPSNLAKVPFIQMMAEVDTSQYNYNAEMCFSRL